MSAFPPDVIHELEGWVLLWADLELREAGSGGIAALRDSVAAAARAANTLETLSSDPVVSAIRKLFRNAGTDPTRYRPSNEALLRRVLKGEPIPGISPIVDLNNCLSAELAVPVCVMDVREIEGPFVFRAGQPGEAYESLRGPFNLEGKPLLVDARGPADTPITGGVRVKARGDTSRVWLVAYMPTSPSLTGRAEASLRRMLETAPVATLHALAFSGAPVSAA
jgi:DNA/RNA-binding domain of Phe-tRNA-synthetase-like protein